MMQASCTHASLLLLLLLLLLLRPVPLAALLPGDA
jgi:hypothetical protein